MDRSNYFWTPEELETLIKLYPTASKEKILKALPRRSWVGIHSKASNLGLKRTSYFWSEKELAMLRELYPLSSKEEILSALPNRTWDSIHANASLLKIRRSNWIQLLDEVTLNVSLIDRAYTTGMLDGEGLIGLYLDKRRKTLYPRVTITNNHVSTLDWMLKVFNIGIIRKTHPRTIESRTYVWEINKINDIIAFLELTLPYLKIKKIQAELLIEFCNLRKQALLSYFDKGRVPYSKREREIFELLKVLKK